MKVIMTSSSDCVKNIHVIVRFVISLIFIEIYFVGVQGQRNVGNSCFNANGRQGECISLQQCPNAQFRRNNQGTCSYGGNSPIVCCLPNERLTFSSSNNNNNNIPQYKQESQENFSFENVNEDTFNGNSNTDYEYTYDQTTRRSSQPWWISSRPFSPTTQRTTPRYTRTTSRWQSANRPNTNRPTTNRPNNGDGSIWSSGNVHRPGSYQPSTSRPATFRPSQPINTRPATTGQPSRPSVQPGKSISEQKCVEYSRSVSTVVGALPLLPNPEPVIINVAKCDYNSVPLIVGGTQSLPGEFPHMAAIGFLSSGKIAWLCGGTLISEFFVMTAAHCAKSQQGAPYNVRLGELDLKHDNDGAQPKDYRVGQIIVHPEYKPPARYNDIALLRLVEKVNFNKFIRPACLYTKNTFSVDKATATGWGKIDFAEDPSDILLKVSLNLIDSKLCNDRYQSDQSTNQLRNGIVQSMLCAGDLNGERDTCQGDSGGPLQIASKDNQCIFHIVGITSFGKFCAAVNTPGVYTRVSAYIPWIESIVWGTDNLYR